MKYLLIGFIIILLVKFFVKLIFEKELKSNCKNGIDYEEYVMINGIKQYIQIRGSNLNNPILFMLHGGATSMVPQSFIYQKKLEKEFIVVNWDQRCVGLTYKVNKKYDKQVTIDELVEDAKGVIEFIQNKLKKEKVFILAHSAGSVLGLKFIEKYPNYVFKYIGVGQIVNMKEAFKNVSEQIEKNKSVNKKDKEKIKSYIKKLENNEFSGLEVFDSSKYFYKYLPSYEINIKSYLNYIFYPRYSLLDKLNYLRMPWKKYSMNFEYIAKEFDARNLQIDSHIPMYFISGKQDYSVSPDIVLESYCNKLKNYCENIKIENCGHSVFTVKPKSFCNELFYIKNNNEV